jgi:hypothetical protein
MSTTDDPAAAGGPALQPESNAAMTTGQFARWLAARPEPIPAGGVPLSSERVRQLCANERMPGCDKRGKNWVITDPAAAEAWCRELGVGVRHHGGRTPAGVDAPAVIGGDGAAGVKHELMTEQVRRLRIDNEKELGSLLPADRVFEVVAEAVSALRLQLEGLDQGVADVVDKRVPELAPEVRRVIVRDVRELLERTVGRVLDDPLGDSLAESLERVASG